jgi:isocitrate/isopropylmalate dehydrogenase
MTFRYAGLSLYRPDGSAPDIAGNGIANPYAMIMSGQMLLAWLGHRHAQPKALQAAAAIERAMEKVIRDGRVLTPGPRRPRIDARDGRCGCRRGARILNR